MSTTDTDEPLVPCKRGCGLYVSTDGSQICGPCEAGDAIVAHQIERGDPTLIRRDFRVGDRDVVRCRGLAIYLVPTAAGPYPEGRLLELQHARAIAKAINDACRHVESLKSPYVDGKAPT